MAKNAALEHYNNGRYSEAERRFREALQQAVLGFGADDPHVASCKNNLAEFYRNTGKYAQAKELYVQAVQQLLDLYGDRHWLYIGALQNLGMCHASCGELQEAKKILKEVLRLRKRAFGDSHYAYADTMFALGHVMWQLREEPREAAALMEGAVQRLEDSGNVDGTPVLTWLMELSEVQSALPAPASAVATLRKAMKLLEGGQGPVVAKASKVSDMLADALAAQGDVAGARRVLSDALFARSDMHGRSLVASRTMIRLAALALTQPREVDALDVAEGLASNADSLSSDLLARCARGQRSWVPWGSANTAPPADRVLERLRAARQRSEALRLLHAVKAERGQAGAAAAALRSAADVLAGEVALAEGDALRAGVANREQAAALEHLTSLLLESKLLLLELLEALLPALRAAGDDPDSGGGRSSQAAAAKEYAQQAETLARELLQLQK